MSKLNVYLVLVCFNGKWVKHGYKHVYNGRVAEIIMIKYELTYVELVNKLYGKLNIDRSRWILKVHCIKNFINILLLR